MTRKYRASLLMAFLAIVFLVLHLWTGWEAFVDEAASQGQAAEWSEYLVVWARDTVENLQSEFWQLAVQFALIAGLLRVVGVEAYEEDVEEVKQKLDKLQARLDAMDASAK